MERFRAPERQTRIWVLLATMIVTIGVLAAPAAAKEHEAPWNVGNGEHGIATALAAHQDHGGGPLAGIGNSIRNDAGRGNGSELTFADSRCGVAGTERDPGGSCRHNMGGD